MSRYQVTVYPDIDNHREASLSFKFPTIDMATASKRSMSNLLLFLQDTVKVMPDLSNCITIEREVADGKWELV